VTSTLIVAGVFTYMVVAGMAFHGHRIAARKSDKPLAPDKSRYRTGDEIRLLWYVAVSALWPLSAPFQLGAAIISGINSSIERRRKLQAERDERIKEIESELTEELDNMPKLERIIQELDALEVDHD